MWCTTGYKLFLTLLHVMGLLPFQIKLKNGRIFYLTKPKLQAVLILFYLMVLLITQTYICYDKIVHHPVVNEWIFVFCTFIIFFVYGVLCGTNLIYSNKLKRIFCAMTIIESKISEIDNLHKYQSRHIFNDIIILELVYLISLCLYLFSIYFYNYELKYCVLFTLGYSIPKIVIIAHSLLYINYFLFIQQYHSIFNKELQMNTFGKEGVSKLLSVRKYFKTLTRELNYYYDRQNLFVVFIYTVWISYELYHLILLIIQEEIQGFDKVLVIFAVSWILILFSALLIMIIVYTMTSSECEKFIPLLINFAIKNQIDDEVRLYLFIC